MLLTKNQIKAVKKLVFKVVRKTMVIQKLPTDFLSCGVDLSSVLVWAMREQRLYSSDTESMEFNIKLDGRPLGGMSIVTKRRVSVSYTASFYIQFVAQVGQAVLHLIGSLDV